MLEYISLTVILHRKQILQPLLFWKVPEAVFERTMKNHCDGDIFEHSFRLVIFHRYFKPCEVQLAPVLLIRRINPAGNLSACKWSCFSYSIYFTVHIVLQIKNVFCTFANSCTMEVLYHCISILWLLKLELLNVCF